MAADIFCSNRIGNGVEVLDRLGKRSAFRRNVRVVEGKERHIEQAKQLECDIGLGTSKRHRIIAMVPGPEKSLAAERIAPDPAERMPVADGEAQVILEPPGTHDAVLVVPAEGERFVRLRTIIGDRLGGCEEVR